MTSTIIITRQSFSETR